MVGTELLLGQVIDTNAAFLARQLAEIGFDVFRKITVGDNKNRIADAIRSALIHSDVVITSGGLGPTVDDKTREAVAIATDRKLVLDEDLLRYIKEFFQRRGIELGENNPRQALIPQNAIPVHNPVGTAPGFIVKHRSSYVISLPGVPRELHHLIEQTVLPFLRQEFSLQTVIKSRVLHAAGIGESNIDRRIADLEESANPTVGLAAHPGLVDIRISAKAKDTGKAQKLLNKMERQLRDRLGEMIYGMDGAKIEEIVVEMLRSRGTNLAVLETNTGGMLACRLTSVPKGIKAINRVLITSLDRAKLLFLHEFEEKNSISSEVSEAFAIRIREEAEVDIGFAVIGDEDPEVGPYNERTGNTYIGLSVDGKTTSQHIQIGGISEEARVRIVNSALDFLRRYLLKLSGETGIVKI